MTRWQLLLLARASFLQSTQILREAFCPKWSICCKQGCRRQATTSFNTSSRLRIPTLFQSSSAVLHFEMRIWKTKNAIQHKSFFGFSDSVHSHETSACAYDPCHPLRHLHLSVVLALSSWKTKLFRECPLLCLQLLKQIPVQGHAGTFCRCCCRSRSGL
mmetsp:Transcript_32955/g.104194  ORF Transcript_32955/g.104194 Transcript_32955/m.104194 type:complete len:159 (-) Transcript_32955:593-1069(-)